MKFACALSTLCVVLGFTGSASAEPYSPSCEIALERIDTARKALVPFRRTLEMARAREYGANGKSMACIVGGRFGGDKPSPCRRSQWQAPTPTKDDLAAVKQYHQQKQSFEELFNQARQTCLLAP
ncbi:MAG: hypothetical protein KC592_05295 [Nitrospira sp.]|nr:hypothetical protein [Nitrospira sp.]